MTDMNLTRRKGASEIIPVSDAQWIKWERAGLITPIRIEGLRAVFYSVDEVQALAAKIRRGTFSVDSAA